MKNTFRLITIIFDCAVLYGLLSHRFYIGAAVFAFFLLEARLTGLDFDLQRLFLEKNLKSGTGAFVVPKGVSELQIRMKGGGGGGAGSGPLESIIEERYP